MKARPTARQTTGTPAPPEVLHEVLRCAADDCGAGADWLHASPWGPHFCDDHTGRIPDALTYLYRRAGDGRLLNDL